MVFPTMPRRAPVDFLVPEAQAGLPLGQMVSQLTGLDPAETAALIVAGAVLHDGQRPRDPRFRVRAGARIQAVLALPPPLEADLRARILFQSPDILVLDKPAGIPSAPTRQGASGTLPELLREQLDLPRAPRIVHRLDREVSGVLAVALTRRGAARLSEAFSRGAVVKEYQALVSAPPLEPAGEITAPIARDPARRGRMRIHPSGEPSRTDYQEIPADTSIDLGMLRLLALRLHTGRTHQIRVHLAHLGCPIVGDRLYGGPQVVSLGGARVRTARLCLQSVHLQLPGAVVGQAAPFSFRAPPPSTPRAWLLGELKEPTP